VYRLLSDFMDCLAFLTAAEETYRVSLTTRSSTNRPPTDQVERTRRVSDAMVMAGQWHQGCVMAVIPTAADTPKKRGRPRKFSVGGVAPAGQQSPMESAALQQMARDSAQQMQQAGLQQQHVRQRLLLQQGEVATHMALSGSLVPCGGAAVAPPSCSDVDAAAASSRQHQEQQRQLWQQQQRVLAAAAEVQPADATEIEGEAAGSTEASYQQLAAQPPIPEHTPSHQEQAVHDNTPAAAAPAALPASIAGAPLPFVLPPSLPQPLAQAKQPAAPVAPQRDFGTPPVVAGTADAATWPAAVTPGVDLRLGSLYGQLQPATAGSTYQGNPHHYEDSVYAGTVHYWHGDNGGASGGRQPRRSSASGGAQQHRGARRRRGDDADEDYHPGADDGDDDAPPAGKIHRGTGGRGRGGGGGGGGSGMGRGGGRGRGARGRGGGGVCGQRMGALLPTEAEQAMAAYQAAAAAWQMEVQERQARQALLGPQQAPAAAAGGLPLEGLNPAAAWLPAQQAVGGGGGGQASWTLPFHVGLLPAGGNGQLGLTTAEKATPQEQQGGALRDADPSAAVVEAFGAAARQPAALMVEQMTDKTLLQTTQANS
jgi:hypothetical protein